MRGEARGAGSGGGGRGGGRGGGGRGNFSIRLQNIQAARGYKSCFPNLDGNFRCDAGRQLFSSVLKSNSADQAVTSESSFRSVKRG